MKHILSWIEELQRKTISFDDDGRLIETEFQKIEDVKGKSGMGYTYEVFSFNVYDDVIGKACDIILRW